MEGFYVTDEAPFKKDWWNPLFVNPEIRETVFPVSENGVTQTRERGATLARFRKIVLSQFFTASECVKLHWSGEGLIHFDFLYLLPLTGLKTLLDFLIRITRILAELDDLSQNPVRHIIQKIQIFFLLNVRGSWGWRGCMTPQGIKYMSEMILALQLSLLLIFIVDNISIMISYNSPTLEQYRLWTVYYLSTQSCPSSHQQLHLWACS